MATAPDIVLGNIALNAVGVSAIIDNRPSSANSGIPCTLWALQWSAQPGITGLALAFQWAPDNNGAPGAFTSVISGTALPSGKALIADGYYPWIRIALTALMGSGYVNAVLTGWRDTSDSIVAATATVTVVPETSDAVNSAGPATIGTTSIQLLAANASRKRLILQNAGTTKIWVLFGSGTASSTNYHLALAAGGTSNDGSSTPYIDQLWTGAVQAISSAAGGSIQAVEFT
jgi:hypothetical protein